MYNYITKIDGAIYYIQKNTIIKGKDVVITHDFEIVFLLNDVFVDSNKAIYKFETINFSKEKLLKLKKGVSDIIINRDKSLYVADRFGDVYYISKDEQKLIFGNACYTTSIIDVKDKLLTSDKYGRIKISQKSGVIDNIVFLEYFPITKLIKTQNMIVASALPNKIVGINLDNMQKHCLVFEESIQKVKIINNNIFFTIFKNQVHIYQIRDNQINFLKRIVANNIIDCEFFDEKLHYITHLGEYYIDGKLIYRGEHEYSNFFQHIIHNN